MSSVNAEILDETRDLLRFAVVGSVDDGKSTLIGRLLYDTKTIFEDQLSAVEEASRRSGTGFVNLALLTDGLKAEREQGITIDVAYRYASTPKRKFIIADCPGHIQYTRNMITGTSSAHLAIVLVDARHGVVEQTKRHAFICSLMQVKHLIVCVNKMDLVDFDQKTFNQIKSEFGNFMARCDIADIRFIPISALNGDNIVEESSKMPWYEGLTLLNTLETVFVSSDYNYVDSRLPVQCVLRPQSGDHLDYRGYAGRVEGGVFKTGDDITVLPSGFTSKIKSIDTFDGPIDQAYWPMSVSINLEDDLDISRGDMIVKPNNKSQIAQDLDVMLCWLSDQPLDPNRKYALKHTTLESRCAVKEVLYKIDIESLQKNEEDRSLRMNDIGRVRLRTMNPVLCDSYKKNRYTGSLILVDEFTNNTVAAGLII